MTNEISIKVTNNVKREDLDKFVSENPVTSIFQTPDMAEVYKRNKGCKPIILAAINEDTNEILASLLAKKLTRKPGILESFSTHSTVRGGPIFLDNEYGIKAASLLLSEYNSNWKGNSIYTRIFPLNYIPKLEVSFNENGYERDDWQNFLIYLNTSKESLYKNLIKSRRNNINKAKRYGVEIEELLDIQMVEVFYNLLRETYKGKFPLEDISNFKAAFDILAPKGMAKFFMAKYKGKYLAGILILLFKGIAYDWYAGSTLDKNDLKVCPNDILAWHAINYAHENGYKLFDFGGGGHPNDNSGFIEFKRQFGGKMVNYGRYSKTHRPTKMWLVNNMFILYKKYL